MGKIFSNLLAEIGIVIQIYPNDTGRRQIPKTKESKNVEHRMSQGFINAIIYGPLKLCESVGNYLTQCGIFLQDPMQNDRDAAYKNPHILSRTEEVVLISELAIESSGTQARDFDTQDLFSQLSKDDHLAFTEAPNAVITKLYPYVYSISHSSCRLRC